MKIKKNYIFITVAVILATIAIILTCIIIFIPEQNQPKEQQKVQHEELQQDSIPKISAHDTVSILIMGDIMQHITQIRAALKPGADPDTPQSYDYSSYFTHLEKYINRSDYTVANMEFTVGVTPYSGYPQFSAPESLAEEVKKAGVDLFLCANNHICDTGEEGIASTIKSYTELGVSFTGLYRNSKEEKDLNPFIAEIKGVRIAFINFTYGTNGLPIPEPYRVNLMDSTHVKRVIARAKGDSVDFIIALPHWGEEYSLTPSNEQKEWKKMLNREGVRIIVGSHPHVVQPLEIERNDSLSIERVTLYSTGNLISNMNRENTQLGIIMHLALRRERESGETEIINAEPLFTWSARAREFERGFTILPIKDFIEKREFFMNKKEYDNMVDTYNNLIPIIYDI